MHACADTIKGWKRTTPRGSVGTVPSAHTGSEIALVPTKQGEDLMIHGDLGRLPSIYCLSSKELLALQ